MKGTGWEAKKIRQHTFLWALGPEATLEITRLEYQREQDKIKIDKLFKLHNRYNLPKKNKFNSRGDFFVHNKQPRKHRKTTGRKLIELEQECDIPDFSTKLLISNPKMSMTCRR